MEPQGCVVTLESSVRLVSSSNQVEILLWEQENRCLVESTKIRLKELHFQVGSFNLSLKLTGRKGFYWLSILNFRNVMAPLYFLWNFGVPEDTETVQGPPNLPLWNGKLTLRSLQDTFLRRIGWYTVEY